MRNPFSLPALMIGLLSRIGMDALGLRNNPETRLEILRNVPMGAQVVVRIATDSGFPGGAAKSWPMSGPATAARRSASVSNTPSAGCSLRCHADRRRPLRALRGVPGKRPGMAFDAVVKWPGRRFGHGRFRVAGRGVHEYPASLPKAG